MNRKKIRLFMFITLIIFILSQAANSQGFETDRALNLGNTIFLRGSAKERITGKLRLISNMESPLKILGVKNKLEQKVSCHIRAIAKGKIYELIVENICNEPTRYRGYLTINTNCEKQPKIVVRVLGLFS